MTDITIIPQGQSAATEITNASELIVKLRELVLSAADSLVEAGEIAVQILSLGMSEADLAAKTGLPPSMVAGLIRIGSSQMLPELLLESSLWACRLRGAPISMQRLIMAQGVEMLIANGEVLKCHPKNMSPDQVRQVFDGSSIRSPEAQRAWLEARQTLPPKALPPIAKEAQFNALVARRKLNAREMKLARQVWEAALTA